VLVDDGVLSKAYTQAVNGYPVEIKTGDLKGDTLAQTEIFYDHAVITVDVLRVDQAHDRLEPVIGHEMYHVVDARLKYGIDSFYQLVERDRNKDWHYRELEMSAIAQENSLRQRLLMQSKYKGMASTRDMQNRRFS
jgi:hypothetical protein